MNGVLTARPGPPLRPFRGEDTFHHFSGCRIIMVHLRCIPIEMQNPMRQLRRSGLAALAFLLTATVAHAQHESDLIRLEFDESNQVIGYDFVNSITGWDAYFNSGFRGGTSSIGMIEAGHAWFGHEVFVRPPDSPDAFTSWINPATGSLNELDYHATTVAHVLAGSGYVPDNGGSYTYAGLGMAPEARLVTGSIATGFSSDINSLGAFDVSTESVITAYREFFRGTTVGRLDVINSSWGGSGDASARSIESLTMDALAYENSSVAHVISAGNGGSSQVSSPASGFNNISVGSLGGTNDIAPSDYSSRGLVDFYHPVTAQTIANARVAVDIAAPGEDLFLAAYLGNGGSIGAIQPSLSAGSPLIAQEPPPTDRYFTALSGTSYSAPIVAGGIALLKDVARAGLGETPETRPDVFDTRTIKSVIMASADATAGWDNGQNAFNVTTQALDMVTGAGALNLFKAADVYLGGTRGSTGGSVGANGWALTNVGLTQAMDFIMIQPFTRQTSLTVALNWFAVRSLDASDLGEETAFANLDLEVWKLNSEQEFVELVGASRTTYNNTEFLRISDLSSGQYAMRVLFPEMIYDTTDSVSYETFALAWSTIPEPDCFILFACGAGLVFYRRRRHA
jgi:hypothetical protein